MLKDSQTLSSTTSWLVRNDNIDMMENSRRVDINCQGSPREVTGALSDYSVIDGTLSSCYILILGGYMSTSN